MFETSFARRRLKEALRLLREERACLLKGDLETLARFEQRRAALISRLPRIPREALEANASLAKAVRAAARGNAALLEAFMEGARSAERRVRALIGGEGALGAYRRDGSRIEPEPRVVATSRRL